MNMYSSYLLNYYRAGAGAEVEAGAEVAEDIKAKMVKVLFFLYWKKKNWLDKKIEISIEKYDL